MERIYLDHAATTPVKEEVFKDMEEFFKDKYGNPSSIYEKGREAAEAITRARGQVKNFISADDKNEIIFTGSGTEADNLAIKGVGMALKERGKHIITSAIEHHAVLHTCEFMEKQLGFEVTYLPVDEDGFVGIKDLQEAIRDDTILITIMMANNEIGTIQPIKEMAAIAGEHDIYFHTDAVQAMGQIPVDVNQLEVDLLSLSAHKFNGPKGAGALYVRKGTRLVPQMNGGAQENRRRASTENVAGIVGLGKAAEIASASLTAKSKRLTKLRDQIIEGITDQIDEVFLNGPCGDKRLPNNVNVCFRYIEGESILLRLDMKGIAASSGSACTSGSLEPSHVLLAIGLSPEVAHGSLRLSLGINNTEEEVDYLLSVLPDIIEQLRSMSPLYED